MELDPEVDAAYPARWIGKVTVHTIDGRVLHGRVDEPKGDPGNTLSRAELHRQGAAPGRCQRRRQRAAKCGRHDAAVGRGRSGRASGRLLP